MFSNATIITGVSITLTAAVYLVSVYYNQPALAILSTSDPSNYSTYENSSFGMKMQYPSDWKKIEDFRGSWFRNTNESVNVRMESIPYVDGSLEELTASQLDLTRQQFPGQVLVESNEITIGNNYPAHKIVFTFPEIPSDLKRTKEMQVWTINGSRAYIISYFTISDAYDNYLPVVQKIIDSLRVTSGTKK